ncbi:MAG TPA: ATPase, T2SS/T4P/T4SS family [Kofleriaceae bacterium]|nr:ATPase, T2SS/T4P/T4SS family [Kofleriaceae bacterium]
MTTEGEIKGETRPRRMELPTPAIADFLATTPLFTGCDRVTISKIASHVFPVEVPAGTVIVRAGTPNPGIGIVYSGRATVRDGGDTIEDVPAGGAFGETGAFLGTTQPHEVAAAEDSVMLLLSHDIVTQLAARSAAFSYAAARRLAARSITRGALPPAPPAEPAGSPPPISLRSTTSPIPVRRPSQTTPPAGEPRAGRSTAPPTQDDIRFVRISMYDPSPQVVSAVPAKLIQQHRLLPLALRDRTLTVGMVDPFNTASRLELQRVLSTSNVVVVAIGQDDFHEAYVRLRIDPVRAARGTRGPDPVSPDQLVFDQADQERDAKQPNPVGDEIVALASRMIAHAIERGASDVHVDHGATGPRIRFRVQGQLYTWDHGVPASAGKSLVARLKVLAGLDVTERRLPQDGRLGVRVGKREVDIRISTIPTSRGEKVALRVFEAQAMLRPLEAIFHDAPILEAVHLAIQRPYGAIVVAGPTGSGKTTTLYAALGERLRTRPDTNALTVEDPIEYRLPGVTQVQVNHAVDLSFAKVLRAMLRQDPDVIMVGEVRDDDTAQLALEAAMTGHLMLTSVHANNAVGVVQRFEHLGCARPLIGQSLALSVVQRLARRLCPRCTTTEVPPPLVLANLADFGLVEPGRRPALPRAVGCAECNQTGYAGRVAVVEMLALDDALRAQIMAGAPITELERLATDARLLYSFRQSALQLMARQMITPAEALLTLT